MKALLTVLIAAAVAVATVSAAGFYPATWDNINLDEILSNDRLVKAYVDCLLDRGKCTPDGAALKKALPEALKTDCAKCTEKQKQGGLKVIKFMIEKKPDLWREVAAKYDPNGQYIKKIKI